MIGTTLSHYKITAKLGEGGMGEVYRAEDARLKREVALKILPADLAGSPERFQRFQREAEALAALDHPNIVTIHSVEEVEGIRFISMQLVQGKPLSELVPAKGMRIDRLLEVSVALADALASAHAKGIVHRDLKPANVMVTEEGRVKVLDFGLAKLGEKGKDAEEGGDPTAALTEEGKILGTLPYMSPEQVQGLDLDARTDIFSFGVMLYEMATGSPPFVEATPADLISSILRDDPASVTDLNQGLPRHLGRVVRRCLAKDPGRRYQSAVDLRNELEDLSREVESGEAFVPGSVMPSGAPVSKTLVIGLVLGLSALFAALVYFLVARGGDGHGSNRTSRMEIRRLTVDGGVRSAVVSPDGRHVVYLREEAGTWALWIRQVSTGSRVEIFSSTQLLGTDLAFTPDGDYVLFAQRSHGFSSDILRIPALGGQPEKLLGDVAGGATPSPAGDALAFRRFARDMKSMDLVVSANDGSEQRVVSSRRLPPFWGNPAWSPDGKYLTLPVASAEDDFFLRLVSYRVADGKETRVSDARWNSVGGQAWLPDGSGIIVSAAADRGYGRQIWLIEHPSGQLRRITNDLNDYAFVSLTADAAGLVTVLEEESSRLAVFDVETSQLRSLEVGVGSRDGIEGLAWIGREGIAFAAHSGNAIHLWLTSTAGEPPRQLTRTGTLNTEPTPCGPGALVYSSTDDTSVSRISRLEFEGGETVHVGDSAASWSPSCSPDGQVIAVTTIRGGKPEIWQWRLEGGTPTRLSDLPGHGPYHSPDGERVLFHALNEDSGNFECAVVSASTGQIEQLLSCDNEHDPKWHPDGSAITWLGRGGESQILWAKPLDGGEPYRLADLGPDAIFTWDWAPDGKRVVMSVGERRADAVLITNLD